MSLLSTLATDSSIENETDVVGGGYSPLDSDIYAAKVDLAYMTKSSGGAIGVVLHLKTDAGRDVRQTVYVTSGEKKGQKNYYEKDGQKHYLPGFNLMNSLALLTVGKELSQLDTEDKVINLYNYEAKAEVPTKVPVITDLMNQPIYAAIVKQLVDKRAKADDGSYQPTGESREENEIDKFFRHKDKMTTAEIRAQAEAPAFFERWQAKWKGEVKDKTTKTAGGGQKAAALSKSNGTSAGQQPTQSLFG